MLRLVCITLPNQQALEKHPLYKLPRPGATGPHGSTESTDHTTPMAGASSLAAMIPLLHRTVIQKLRREVTALASAEILRSLMDVHPITEEVLALVQRELSLLPALHVTNFEVKLRVLLLLKSEILIVLAILFIINSVINSAIILQIFCLHSVITSPRRIIYQSSLHFTVVKRIIFVVPLAVGSAVVRHHAPAGGGLAGRGHRLPRKALRQVGTHARRMLV
jgi:hypothetical protein